MTTEPAGREDLAWLLENLTEEEFENGGMPYNRDGKEAHAAIIKLEQENAKLRGAAGEMIAACDFRKPTTLPYMILAALKRLCEALRADGEEE